MSAGVEPLTWGWYCADCCEGGDGPSEDAAVVGGTDHNREYHNGAEV